MKTNNIIKDINMLVDEILDFPFETLEEIPIINRYHQLDPVRHNIAEKDYNTLLLSTCIMVLNAAILAARKKLSKEELKNFFISISIYYYSEDMEDHGFCIPHVYICGLDGWQKQSFLELERCPLENSPFWEMSGNLIGLDSFTVLRDKVTPCADVRYEYGPERYYLTPSFLLDNE